MQIIDTHAHIDQLEDLPGALTRAHEAGVTDIVAVSVDLGSMQKVLGIAQQYQQPRIHGCLGIHPGMIKPEEQQAAFDFMRANVKQARAIGETGLDYWYKWVRKDEIERRKQKDSFQFHLDLGREFDLPVIVHSRGAWRDALGMAIESKARRVLFHWYSGPLDIMEQILSAGFYVSTSPSVAYSPESQRAMTQAPLERILIETDSPVTYREAGGSFQAEPRDVQRTWKALAKLKNLDEGQVLAAVNANAQAFFGIMK